MSKVKFYNLIALFLFLVYEGLNKRPKFATTINHDLRNVDDLPAQFKAMGLSSASICVPAANQRIQTRRWARQSTFTPRPENTGIYRSPKGEPEKSTLQKFISGLISGKNDGVCYLFSMYLQFKYFQASKLDKKDQEKLNQYKEELKRLPAAEQKVFLDGYVQGLLTSNKSSEQAPPKKSVLPRLYALILITIVFAFWGGLIRVRFGDKSLGSFIFSRDDEIRPEDVGVTFEDVRGMDEAKLEVAEIVDYLRDKEKYSKLGGRLPKGVLMVGSPGTGWNFY